MQKIRLSPPSRVCTRALLVAALACLMMTTGAALASSHEDIFPIVPVLFSSEPGSDVALVEIPLRPCEDSSLLSFLGIAPVFGGTPDLQLGAIECQLLLSGDSSFSDYPLPVSAEYVTSRLGFDEFGNSVLIDVTEEAKSIADCGRTLYAIVGSLSEDAVGVCDPDLSGQSTEWMARVVYKK